MSEKHNPFTVRQSLAELLNDQTNRWQQGDRVPVETYLARQPQLLSETDSVLDLIYNEIFLREQQGERARLGEYVRRFPQWSRELKLQFEVHQAIETTPGAPGDVSAGVEFSVRGNVAGPPVVPGYKVLGEIGRGGMGVVYKARDLAAGRLAALKMLLPEHFKRRAALKRFLAEARAVLALDHPHIVKVFQIGECAAGPFYAMEWIAGPTLETVTGQGPIGIPRAIALVISVAEAVDSAHRQGIIHRDLKPANIMVHPKRGPVVMDFGLAKVRGKGASPMQSSTQSGTILGTPAYMPPEQTGDGSSPAGPYSDVYSLGAILYALLTGRPPFDEGTPLKTIMKVRSSHPPPPIRAIRADVPVLLERICMKCLNKKPEDRYAAASELANELRGC